MADHKEHQPSHPVTGAANVYPQRDTEVPAHDSASRELKKNKRKKLLLYITLFIIFQTGIIAVFSLTILKVRTPRVRLNFPMFHRYNVGTPSNPSLDINMNVEVAIKNTNFGRYVYRDARVAFFYRGYQMGEGFARGRVNWRSTRNFGMFVELSMANAPPSVVSQLGEDLRTGIVPITSQFRTRGRVEVMFVMKKNRGTSRNCSMDVVTATQGLGNIVCG